MGEPKILEKIIDYFTYYLPRRYKELRCNHSQVVTVFTAETFLIEKWERCSGVGYCRNCGKDFSVMVAANPEERKSEYYLGY